MIWERIRELEQEEARAKAQREAQAQADERKREIERAEENQRQKREEELRNKEKERRRKIVEETLSRSGLLDGMKQLERGLSGQVRRHALMVNLDEGTATLVWGNKFTLTAYGNIAYERSLLSRYGQKEYSYIQARVDTSTESVNIDGNSVAKDRWQTDRAVVIDLLAKAYRNPGRVNDRETPPVNYSSGSSGSSSTECCNN